MILKLIIQIELDHIVSFYRLSKLTGRYNCDLTPYEIDKCKNDTFVFDGDDCIIKALDFSLKFKGEARKVKNKIVEYNLQLHAQNGSGSDRWIVLKNHPCDKHIVDINENGKGIISLSVFNGYIHNNEKQTPQYLIFRCGMTHLNYSLKKIGETFQLKKVLLKTETNHDEI